MIDIELSQRGNDNVYMLGEQEGQFCSSGFTNGLYDPKVTQEKKL